MAALYLSIIGGIVYLICGFFGETDLKELAKWLFIICLAAYMFR